MVKLGLCTPLVFLVFMSAPALAQPADVANVPVETTPATAADLSAPQASVEGALAVPHLTPPEDEDEYIDFSPHVPLGPRPHRVGAVFAEFGLGALGVGVGTGITIGLLAASLWRAPDGVVLGSLLLGAVFTFALADAGIYGAGELSGGRGSSSWTALGILLGAGVGTALGLGLAAALTHAHGDFSETSFLVSTFTTPGFGLVGGIVAYELSDRAERRRLRQPLAVVPVAGPIEGGLGVGLAGRF